MSVRDAVRHVVDEAAGRADGRQVAVKALVDPGVPDTVVTDPLRLRQVVTHLVDNALKFTSDGQVQLDVDVVADGDDAEMLRFRVTDTGIGMDPEVLAAIFAPFNQADVSSTRRFGGTGLGLAISRKIAELMGGCVTAASEPGRGSVFTFAVPLTRADTPPPPPDDPPLPPVAPVSPHVEAGYDPARALG